MTDIHNPEFIRRLNAHLNAGGVIAFPTDTVWGLGALPTPAGADALYAIKHRPREKHLIIMSDCIDHIRPHMARYPAAAFDLARKYWPGGLTIAIPVADNDTMVFGGVRVPNYKPFMDLCRVIDGHCLATTSANISGMPPLTSADAIKKTFPEIIVIDNAYDPMGGMPSTVALCDGNTVRVIRPGAVTIQSDD
ncbi:MAG: L-threonylcarbamoyladenylate synthase [Alphaproteobacteria bacterium]|nr:L-threonylcarbamoyladenylate synthase [Alphaproteobacteria bacterium]